MNIFDKGVLKQGQHIMSRNIGHFFLPAALAVVMSSCTGEEHKTYTVGISQCATDAWRIQMNEDLKREAMLYDDIAVRISVSDRDNGKQIADIRDFIRTGTDVIVVSPNEGIAIAPVVEEAARAGIPVIIVDRKADTDAFTTFIGADNYLIGSLVGEHVNSILPPGGKVVEICGSTASTPSAERSQGFMDNLSPELDIICAADAAWEERNAYIVMSRILKKYDDIDLVFAHNDDMAIGAYNAAKEAGREDEILFIGVDALMNRGVEMVSEGILEATFIYPNGVEEIMETAQSILEGEPVPREIPLSTAMVTKANVRLMEMQDIQERKQYLKLKALHERLGSYTSSYNNQRTALLIIIFTLCCVIILTVCLFILLKKRSSMNRKLIQQRDRMRVMAREIEESSRSKLAFFTNISHDLRTPLSLISGPFEKLKDSALPEAQRKKYIGIISRNIDFLMRLVNQLLDFRKSEQGKMSFNPVRTDFLQEIRKWNESFELLLNKKEIRFDFKVADETPYIMMADMDKLEKVYYNILSNAFKFTPSHGTITVSLSKENENGKACMKLVIHNSGSWIPPEETESIFERFYQSRSSSHASGVGIGLALARMYTNRHNGTITAESDKETGTAFIVTLPLIQEESGNLPVTVENAADAVSGKEQERSQAEFPERTASGKPVILIIDDNKDMTEWLEDLLGESYSTISANSGEKGYDLATRQLPDLIISDIMMPGTDGHELVRMLKATLVCSHIPVILLTARNLEEQRVEGYESGADSYITKPFKSEVLLSRIQNLLQGREVLKKSFEDGMMSLDNTSGEDEFMHRFKEYLDAHISSTTLGIDEICSAIGVSRTQLYRKIKSMTGMSANGYIRIFRLKKALMLLKKGNVNVSQAGYEVGFNSSSYFIKCFKDYFGETPSEYMTKIKGK